MFIQSDSRNQVVWEIGSFYEKYVTRRNAQTRWFDRNVSVSVDRPVLQPRRTGFYMRHLLPTENSGRPSMEFRTISQYVAGDRD